jgi:serine/threonine protein kinase
MAQDWYVESGGNVDGPISARELRDRAATGRLLPTDRVSQDRKKWSSASKVKGLKFASPSPAPPDPQPTRASTQSFSEAGTVESQFDRIPGYEILGVLGKGACGIVFRARQVKLDRIVALKMVLSERTATAKALARFDKEAVSLAKLKHPNIVAIHDCGHHIGQPYFAMELLDGEDLGRRLERSGPFDEFTAWHIARQTAAALAHAAELGVFHRDIKPANLFLTQPPTGYPLPPGIPLVKVTDFGLAFTRQTGDEATDARLTAAGVVLGTPVYMPPEQFAGSEIDHRADIYALGATLFHILSGQPPFDGSSMWEIMVQKSETDPRLDTQVSPESADLVAAMMTEDPEDRIGTYQELLDRIDALPCMRGGHASLHARQSASLPGQRRGRKRLYILGAVVAVLLAAGIGIAVKLSRMRPVEFVTDNREELFNRESMQGWTPISGQAWAIEQDDEKTAVLSGKGEVRRPFRPTKNFRVVLGVDLHEASVAEVVVAVADGPADTAKHWSVQITRDGVAAFGVRDGERSAFRPLGAAIPVKTRKQLEEEGRVPYVEVLYERSGGKFRAWYSTQLLGEIEDSDKLKSSEVRVIAEGGAIRIDTAAVEELVERK